MPSVYWVGDVNSDARNPENWYPIGVPAGNDDLYIYGAGANGNFGEIDRDGDGIYEPRIPGNDLTGLIGDWATVRVELGYAGTITLGANPSSWVGWDEYPYLPNPEPAPPDPPLAPFTGAGMTFARLWLNAPAANISQYHPLTGEVTPLTINDANDPWAPEYYPAAFTWLGGSLNDTTVATTVTVDGTTALVDPYSGDGTGTVSTGSTLNFINGAEATVNSGTVSFTGGLGTIIESATLIIQPAGATATFSRNASGTSATQNYIGFGGSISVVGPGVWESTNGLPVYNDGGTFDIRGGAEARVTGETGPEGYRGSVYQRGATGLTLLDATSKLKIEDDLSIVNGRLATIASTVADQAAIIDGRLEFSGGDIVLGDPAYTVGADHIYSRLRIKDTFHWSGGIYRPFVGRTAAGVYVHDQIISAHQTSIEVGESGPRLGPIGPYNPGGANLSGRRWSIITSPNEIFLEDDDATSMPFETAPQEITWSNSILREGAGDVLSLRYN